MNAVSGGMRVACISAPSSLIDTSESPADVTLKKTKADVTARGRYIDARKQVNTQHQLMLQHAMLWTQGT